MNTLFIDFESYYSTKQKYDLKNISVVEYVRSPLFYVQGMGIKFDDGEAKWITGKDVAEVLEYIDWGNTRVVAHNVKFDGAILAWHYGHIPAQWIDTKAMAKAILGSSVPSHSLRTVAEYLGLPAKGDLKTNNIKELTPQEEQELATYCKRDVDLCHDIFYSLLKYFPNSQWKIMDWTVRAFLEPQLEIDMRLCEKVRDSIIANKKTLIANTGIAPSVFRSNQQFAKLLENEGFTVPKKKNKNGKLIPALAINDKEFLKLQLADNDRLNQLIAARIAAKQTLEETRADKLATIAKISRYCFDVIFSGATQTHRFSGGNGCAGNPQNFRRGSDLRAAIKAPDFFTLIVADFSNIELRILAFLSRDEELMNAIKNNEDVYCKFASKIYNRTIAKKDKKERTLGKAAVLGLGYGMGWEKFRNTVFAQTGEMISEEFAKEIVQLYRDTYVGVPQFWMTCERMLEQLANKPSYFPGVDFLKVEPKRIILPSGLKLRYPNLRFHWKRMWGKWKKEWVYDKYKSKKSKVDETKIYGGMLTENLCQALAGEICKEAISRLIDYGYSPSGQIHDELLVVCPKEEKEKVTYLVKTAMTQPVSWWPELPLKVEVESGKNWKECK